MRFLAMLLIGLFMGALGSTMTLKALQARHLHTRGLMGLIDLQQRRLHTAISAEACNRDALGQRLDTLHLLSGLVTETFAEQTDAIFRRYQAQFSEAVDKARAAAASAPSCSTMVEPIARIDDTCDACHRDYR